MEEAISIEQVDQAAGILAQAAAQAPMPMAAHQNCHQAVQIIAKYIQQTRAAQAAKVAPKE
jgi:hypothetical protein